MLLFHKHLSVENLKSCRQCETLTHSLMNMYRHTGREFPRAKEQTLILLTLTSGNTQVFCFSFILRTTHAHTVTQGRWTCWIWVNSLICRLQHPTLKHIMTCFYFLLWFQHISPVLSSSLDLSFYWFAPAYLSLSFQQSNGVAKHHSQFMSAALQLTIQKERGNPGHNKGQPAVWPLCATSCDSQRWADIRAKVPWTLLSVSHWAATAAAVFAALSIICGQQSYNSHIAFLWGLVEFPQQNRQRHSRCITYCINL